MGWATPLSLRLTQASAAADPTRQRSRTHSPRSCDRSQRQHRRVERAPVRITTSAITTVREYNSADGHPVRVFSASRPAKFRKPRGLRFGPDDKLYCVARDEVVAFNFISGECFGSTVQFPLLYGQAIEFFP